MRRDSSALSFHVFRRRHDRALDALGHDHAAHDYAAHDYAAHDRRVGAPWAYAPSRYPSDLWAVVFQCEVPLSRPAAPWREAARQVKRIHRWLFAQAVVPGG